MTDDFGDTCMVCGERYEHRNGCEVLKVREGDYEEVVKRDDEDRTDIWVNIRFAKPVPGGYFISEDEYESTHKSFEPKPSDKGFFDGKTLEALPDEYSENDEKFLEDFKKWKHRVMNCDVGDLTVADICDSCIFVMDDRADENGGMDDVDFVKVRLLTRLEGAISSAIHSARLYEEGRKTPIFEPFDEEEIVPEFASDGECMELYESEEEFSEILTRFENRPDWLKEYPFDEERIKLLRRLDRQLWVVSNSYIEEFVMEQVGRSLYGDYHGRPLEDWKQLCLVVYDKPVDSWTPDQIRKIDDCLTFAHCNY